ncbi:MAG: CheR family methyltransferase [Hyphomicrobiaceae bacterium]
MPELFGRQGVDRVIRVWVAGCATGEEAYSLAILLLEEAARREMRPDIQLFATDLDDQALAVAREGRYPTAIAADVSEDRLRRFFVREGEQYRIRREVRDLVVFASHSLLRDPPFSRIDLVSCRNLMIYLDRDLQQQVCTILHYALVPNGFLILGTSETADSPTGLFSTFDREARIYRACERSRDTPPMLPRGIGSVRIPDMPGPRPSRPPMVVDAALHRRLLEDIAPPSLLIDEAQRIANLSETAGRFLLQPGGPMMAEAAEVVRPELRLELRAALNRAFEQNLPTVTLPIPVRFNGKPKAVVMFVRPIRPDSAPSAAALVLFLEGDEVEVAGTDGAQSGEGTAVVSQLRDELQATRTRLRTIREQYEAATEELRAANEELQSINEEYRSTAEELETSKEELQSINEELQTLNNELKLKLEMVSRAHNDLQNLMSATDISTMFLDSSLRIQRFTPRVAELFNVQAGDEGRPVTDFTNRLEYAELVEDARRVLANLIPIERTVHSDNGRWYLIRLRPYRTLDDKIDGIVATFVDDTERHESEAAWQKRQKMLLDEFAHRVKNTLSVVQALARLTLVGSTPEEALDAFESRLGALAASHELLVRSEWRGASLDALARQQLAPYLSDDQSRVQISGPALVLPPDVATPLGLILHELATNAAKHGALRSGRGNVRISWETRDLEGGVRVLELKWLERGGRKAVVPERAGTGWRLIDASLPNATVKRDYGAKGLTCELTIPLNGELPPV